MEHVTSVFRGKTLISVAEDVVMFVTLPGVEHLAHVRVVGVVSPAVLHEVHHEVRLKVNLLVTVRQGLVPGHPAPPAGLPVLLAGQFDVPQYELDSPEAADVEHGVGVVLVLGPAVEQPAVASLLPHDTLVQPGRVEDVAGLQSETLPAAEISTQHEANGLSVT